MKNLFILLLLSILTMSFSACRKDKGRAVEGFVLEYGTQTPIAGVTVKLYDCINFASDCTLTDTLLTSSDGSYHFDLDPNVNTANKISITHPAYFNESEANFIVSTGTEIASDAILNPHAYIKLHVENVAPVDELDRIIIAGFPGIESTDNLGTDVLIKEILLAHGNRNIGLFWEIRKDGEITRVYDTIQISAHDTLHYEILY